MAENEDTKKRDSMAWLKRMGEDAEDKADAEAAKTPQQMFLPGFDIGAFPSHLNRSSFIAPIARGRRKSYRQEALVTRADCVLEYTGEQLDEADGDVLMALIAMAQPYPMGTPVPLNRAAILKKIGRSDGKKQYDWLHKVLKRLREGVMFLEARKRDGSTRYHVGKMTSFNVLKDLDFDEMGINGGEYTYTLDPRWVVLFSNREYSLLDWDKRMQIQRGQDMAKTLQRLVATSRDSVQRYSLEHLKAKMEYSSPMRKFRDAVAAAVAELVRLEILAKGSIEDSTKGKPQLVLWLPTVAAVDNKPGASV